MKRSVLLIIILSLSTFAIYSNGHRLGFKFEGGYNDLFIPLSTQGHFGTKLDIGIVYELQDRHLLLQTGVGLNYVSNIVHNNLYSGTFENMIDTDNDAYILTFPQKATPIERMMLVGMVMMVNVRYFEEDACCNCGNVI